MADGERLLEALNAIAANPCSPEDMQGAVDSIIQSIKVVIEECCLTAECRDSRFKPCCVYIGYILGPAQGPILGIYYYRVGVYTLEGIYVGRAVAMNWTQCRVYETDPVVLLLSDQDCNFAMIPDPCYHNCCPAPADSGPDTSFPSDSFPTSEPSSPTSEPSFTSTESDPTSSPSASPSGPIDPGCPNPNCIWFSDPFEDPLNEEPGSATLTVSQDYACPGDIITFTWSVTATNGAGGFCWYNIQPGQTQPHGCWQYLSHTGDGDAWIPPGGVHPSCVRIEAKDWKGSHSGTVTLEFIAASSPKCKPCNIGVFAEEFRYQYGIEVFCCDDVFGIN